jgi:hypothetical protein
VKLQETKKKKGQDLKFVKSRGEKMSRGFTAYNRN